MNSTRYTVLKCPFVVYLYTIDTTAETVRGEKIYVGDIYVGKMLHLSCMMVVLAYLHHKRGARPL